MRTLIISDLHLGMRRGQDVLRRRAAREPLLEAMAEVDRLVLLGDVVELMDGRPRRAMTAAEPVVRALGTALGSGRQVVIVPGNHDGPLVRSWIRRRGSDLRPEERIDPDATPLLSEVVRWLSPAQVEVRYPGVWLRPGTWATHGHYLNHHLLPASAYGLPRGALTRIPASGARAWHYERGGGRGASDSGWRNAAQSGLSFVRRELVIPVQRRLLDRRLAPVTSAVLELQVQYGAGPALAQVAQRLRVDADWVIFGHVHRRGVLEAQSGRDGGPTLVGVGSWLYEPLLVNGADSSHPYWPGGAVRLEGEDPPEAVGLLEDLAPEALRSPLR